MSTLLDQAIDELRALPADVQDALARDVLTLIHSEREWDRLFADPRSKDMLQRLADDADSDEVFSFDPATRPASKAAE
jgi:hypothetical protein